MTGKQYEKWWRDCENWWRTRDKNNLKARARKNPAAQNTWWLNRQWWTRKPAPDIPPQLP